MWNENSQQQPSLRTRNPPRCRARTLLPKSYQFPTLLSQGDHILPVYPFLSLHIFSAQTQDPSSQQQGLESLSLLGIAPMASSSDCPCSAWLICNKLTVLKLGMGAWKERLFFSCYWFSEEYG